MNTQELHRVLIVDDDEAIIVGYQLVLSGLVLESDPKTGSDTNDLASDLFADELHEDNAGRRFLQDVVCCTQGLDGVRAVEQSISDGEPFSVAFIDMRMPPGIDGLETAKRIRAIDPHINIVIVTGYSDYHPHEIAQSVGPPDKLFCLAKPFEPMEIQQLAAALSHKRLFETNLERKNEELVGRCAELQRINAELTASAASSI